MRRFGFFSCKITPPCLYLSALEYSGKQRIIVTYENSHPHVQNIAARMGYRNAHSL